MKRVLVTGGTGFVGLAVVRALMARGDAVSVLTRNPEEAKGLPRGVRVAAWTATRRGPWYEELGVVDAVVHLAGASIAERWTAPHRARIRKSRIDSTRHLVEAISEAQNRPTVLVSASATGYFGGHRPGEVLDEHSKPGKDFVAEICTGWEAEAKKAEDHDVRAVQLRFGVVLGAGGGALDKMVLPGRLGASRIGTGDNHISWIHIDDVVGMILRSVDDAEASGAYNCTSPFPTTGRELANSIGSVLGRPVVPAPEFVVKTILGEAIVIVTGSLNVFPKRAVEELEYEYRHARLVPALESALMADE